MEFGVVVVAAGEGRRFGRPKAEVELDGKRLLDWCAAAFAGFADRVAVVPAGVDLPGWKCVPGGARRRDSVAAGLAALHPTTGMVLIHDGARPLVSPALIERVVEAAAAGSGAVVPAIPVADTIKEVAGRHVVATPARSRLVAVQTPQAFSLDLLQRALDATDDDATDEAALVEALGENVQAVPGDPENLKITTPLDLEFAVAILSARAEA